MLPTLQAPDGMSAQVGDVKPRFKASQESELDAPHLKSFAAEGPHSKKCARIVIAPSI